MLVFVFSQAGPLRQVNCLAQDGIGGIKSRPQFRNIPGWSKNILRGSNIHFGVFKHILNIIQ